MAWAKWSDTAGNHPYFARVFDLEYYDFHLKLELFGFLGFCASHSAQFFTDYVVEEAKVKELGGMVEDRTGHFKFNYQRLLDAALKTGFFEATVKDEKGRIGYKILEDPQNFVHLIRLEEDNWNKGRQRDLNNTDLKGKVRMRDGDQCRWCGKIVNWDAKTGGRAGSYDHAEPGVTADGDVEKLYVSCLTCNKARQDGRHWSHKVRAAPKSPYYSETTVKKLAQWGFNVPLTAPPLFKEVDPNSVETASVEPKKAPQQTPERTVPSTSAATRVWTPVEPNSVEPAQQVPERTVPVDDQAEMLRRFEQDLEKGELESAPEFVRESVEARQPLSPRRAPVERRQEAPGNKSYRIPAGADKNLLSGSWEHRVGSGREGTGRAEDYPRSEVPYPHKAQSPTPRKRKRRRKRKSNG